MLPSFGVAMLSAWKETVRKKQYHGLFAEICALDSHGDHFGSVSRAQLGYPFASVAARLESSPFPERVP